MPSDNPHLVPQLLAGAVVVAVLSLAATVELGGSVRAASTSSAGAAGAVDARQPARLRTSATVVAGAASGVVTSAAERMLEGRHTTSMRETWAPFFENLRRAAQRADDADDDAMQALAIADVAMTCGQCHRASKARLGLHQAAPRPDDAVHVHAWAAAQLWVGLTGPSDRAWREGVAALSDDTVVGASVLHGTSPIVAASERARFFGRVLSSCGGCHDAQDHDVVEIISEAHAAE